MEERQPTVEELTNRQILAEGAIQEYANPKSDTSEYIQEFTKDKSFKFDQDGNVQEGTIPEENTVNDWAVTSPNFVLGNLTKDFEFRKLELLEMEADFVDSMYRPNPALAQSNPEAYRYAVLLARKMKNKANVKIYSFMRKTRAKDALERKQLNTRTVATQINNPDKAKTGGGLGGALRGLFGGK
jgi:hypothetical protein